VQVTLSPVWRSFFWPIFLTALSGVPLGWLGLRWPSRTQLRSGIRLAIDGVNLILTCALLKAGTWVDVSSRILPSTTIEELAKWTNTGVWIGLMTAAVMISIDAVLEVRRIFLRKTLCTAAMNGLVASR
jgi:hypothetical protein